MDKIENLTPLITLKHTCGDTAEDLGDVSGFVAQSSGKNVAKVTITCESYDIRFAWGAVPTQAGLGHILSAGGTLELVGHKLIIGFSFINKTNGDDAILQITPELSV